MSKHVTFRAQDSLVERLDDKAKAERRSRGFTINEILERYFHESAPVSSSTNGHPKKKAGKK